MNPRARVQAATAAVTAMAMVATPLNRRGGAARRVLSSVVVGGWFVTTVVASSKRWGGRRAVLAAGATTSITTAVERIGTSTGWPFGEYSYTPALRPKIADVPVIVPLAWFAMAVPARETAHAALASRSTPVRRIVGGAAALTAWDLFLDPQMVGEGYWRWAKTGRYRGIPGGNFLGWFATGLAVMTILEIVLPPDEPAPELVGEYGFMAIMETLGFGVFFKDRLVALVGGAGMLPIAAIAAAKMLGGGS